MSKLERTVVTVLFICILAAFQYASWLKYYSSQLDSAMMVEDINTTFSTGAPISQINWSALKAISTVITQSAEQVCAQPLQMNHVESIAMFQRHAYGILYVLAPFRAIASGPAIAASFHALAFVGLLFAAYLFLRKEKLPITAALLFCAMLIAHPAWSESVFGQFYPDRFFILLGFIYAVLVYRRLSGEAESTVAIILIALLASSLTERAAIMIGCFTLVSLILFRGWRGWSKQDLPLLGISAVVLTYALSYMALVQNNSDYGSFSQQALSFLSNVNSNESFRLNLEKYLLINLPYLILALFEWRLALIAFGTMLPNIVGSIGGAEKTGWSIHYHSMYFPFLIAAACFGILRLWQLIEKYRLKIISYALLVTMVICIMKLDPYTLSPLLKFNQSIQHNAMFRVAHSVFKKSGDEASMRAYVDFSRKISGAVPDNVAVSTMEGMMPTLLGHGRVLHYYPLGLASADYLVLDFSREADGKILLSGAVSYLGADNLAALNTCLNSRIWSEGYQIESTFSPGASKDYGVAVLKRMKKG